MALLIRFLQALRPWLLAAATAWLPFTLKGETKEYQIKAAMLFNFAQFVEWPSSAFISTNSPFIIGVLGSDPFGRALEEVVQGEEINGRKLELRRYHQAADARECQILFISRSEDQRWPLIRQALAGAPVLTVSDLDRFAPRGGAIHLFLEQNRVRLRINMEAARQAQLIISSKLLRLAEIIEKTDP